MHIKLVGGEGTMVPSCMRTVVVRTYNCTIITIYANFWSHHVRIGTQRPTDRTKSCQWVLWLEWDVGHRRMEPAPGRCVSRLQLRLHDTIVPHGVVCEIHKQQRLQGYQGIIVSDDTMWTHRPGPIHTIHEYAKYTTYSYSKIHTTQNRKFLVISEPPP